MKSLAQIFLILMGMAFIGGSTLIDKRANVAKLEKLEQTYRLELDLLKTLLDSANKARNDEFIHLKKHIFKQYVAALDENESLERERNHLRRLCFNKVKSEPSPRDTIISAGYGTLDTNAHVYHIPIKNRDSLNHPINHDLIQPIHYGKTTIYEE